MEIITIQGGEIMKKVICTNVSVCVFALILGMNNILVMKNPIGFFSLLIPFIIVNSLAWDKILEGKE